MTTHSPEIKVGHDHSGATVRTTYWFACPDCGEVGRSVYETRREAERAAWRHANGERDGECGP